MTANRNLLYFEENFKTEKERQIHDFKQQALEREFSKTIEEAVRILFDVEKNDQFRLKARLNIKKVLLKIKYKDWKKNAIEYFYIFPLE